MTRKLSWLAFAVVPVWLSGTALAQDAVPDPEGGAAPEAAPVAAQPVAPASPAGAGEEPAAGRDRGAIVIGLRTGYALPFGKAGRTSNDPTDSKVSEDVKGVIPLQLDAGYRFNPTVYLGLYFQYGFGIVNSGSNPECSQSGVSCSVSDLRLGLNVEFHLAPGQSFNPWIGLGAGYEWLVLDATVGGTDAGVTGSGFEFANLQLGGDIPAARNLAVGPFVGFSLGQYRSVSTSGGGGSMTEDITNKSLHEWLEFGIRGTFDIEL